MSSKRWVATMLATILLISMTATNAGAVTKPKPKPRAHVTAGGTGFKSSAYSHENQTGVGKVLHHALQTFKDAADTATHYVWKPSCTGGAYACPPSNCPKGQHEWRYWALDGSGAHPTVTKCAPGNKPPAGPPPPVVTAALVLRAFRAIPVPSFKSLVEPAGKTLVNFDTIFYTQAKPFSRTVTLLGQSVRLDITPSQFHWNHGDGTTTVTTTPGAPYPAKDVVYRYQQAHVTVDHSVTIVWTATWSLNGGPRQTVPGTVTTTGPPTALRIAEATPALSGAGH